jgi:hypothetical protein
LPRDWEFSYIRVEYLIPAVFGDIFTIERYEFEEKYIIVMRKDAGKVFSIVEFA